MLGLRSTLRAAGRASGQFWPSHLASRAGSRILRRDTLPVGRGLLRYSEATRTYTYGSSSLWGNDDPDHKKRKNDVSPKSEESKNASQKQKGEDALESFRRIVKESEGKQNESAIIKEEKHNGEDDVKKSKEEDEDPLERFRRIVEETSKESGDGSGEEKVEKKIGSWNKKKKLSEDERKDLEDMDEKIRKFLNMGPKNPNSKKNGFFDAMEDMMKDAQKDSEGGNKNDKQKADDPFGTMWAKFRSMPPLAQAVVAIVVGNVLMTWLASMMGGSSEGPGEQNEISQHTLLTKVLEEGQVQDITIRDNVALVRMKDDPRGTFVVKFSDLATFEKKLIHAQRELGIAPSQYVDVKYTYTSPEMAGLYRAIPFFLFVGVMLWAMRKMGKDVGGLMGRMSNKPKQFNADMKVRSKFSDVAGLHEAKDEVMEFVSFLKNPTKYSRLGARIPKGALLVGPPGTGKTLLAKAVAGEAGVPFFSASGSDFVEMFVGMGSSRVRSLFKEARKNAPSIVFIDEIDAGRCAIVGKERSGGKTGFNDEAENTLNQLLVEMDGFSTEEGVVVLAGTNRADILDKALLRAGRFDRQITVGLPDISGRKDLFEVHLRNIKLKQVEPEDGKEQTPQESLLAVAKRMAALTPGMSGADIANVCNEAALIAARKKLDAVDTACFEQAIERIIGGLEKKSLVLSLIEKRKVAFHEAGHAVVGWFLEHADPILKVSIVPRGSSALGYAQTQTQDRYLLSREQLFDQMCMLLGGRVAEELCFGEISSGAQDDLEKVARSAYAQVAMYGMSNTVGTLSFPSPHEMEFERPYSQATAEMFDIEVRDLVERALEHTRNLLNEKKDILDKIGDALLVKEVLSREDMVAIAGPRPFKIRTSYDEVIEDSFKPRQPAESCPKSGQPDIAPGPP